MKALILAGGIGKRLRPLTESIPKPLIEVNKKPILERIIEWLKENEITEIILSVGYLHEKIKDYFKDGSQWGVKIDYLIEDTPLGTGGPLNLGKKKLNCVYYYIIVIYTSLFSGVFLFALKGED